MVCLAKLSSSLVIFKSHYIINKIIKSSVFTFIYPLFYHLKNNNFKELSDLKPNQSDVTKIGRS